MTVFATISAFRSMLDIYMKEDMEADESEITQTFLIFGAVFTAFSVPAGLVQFSSLK